MEKGSDSVTKDLTATEVAILSKEVTATTTLDFSNPINDQLDLEGEFIIGVLTPSMDVDKRVTDSSKSDAIRIVNKNQSNISSSKAVSKNYVTLKIPFGIAINFITSFSFINSNEVSIKETANGGDSHTHNAKIKTNSEFEFKTITISFNIPKGTEFLVGFIGMDPNKIRLLGVNCI